MTTCVTPSCTRARAKDSDRCTDCRLAQWTLREPEWVRRAKAKTLPAKWDLAA